MATLTASTAPASALTASMASLAVLTASTADGEAPAPAAAGFLLDEALAGVLDESGGALADE